MGEDCDSFRGSERLFCTSAVVTGKGFRRPGRRGVPRRTGTVMRFHLLRPDSESKLEKVALPHTSAHRSVAEMNTKESQDESRPAWAVGAAGLLVVLFGIWGFVGEEADWNYPAGLVALGLGAVARAYAKQSEPHAKLAQAIASVLVAVGGALIVLGLFL